MSVSAGARLIGGDNVLRLDARINVLTNRDHLKRTRQSAVYMIDGGIVDMSRVVQVTRGPPEHLPYFSLQHAQTPA